MYCSDCLSRQAIAKKDFEQVAATRNGHEDLSSGSIKSVARPWHSASPPNFPQSLCLLVEAKQIIKKTRQINPAFMRVKIELKIKLANERLCETQHMIWGKSRNGRCF
ncbi:hypothetical protein CK510_05585 [Brunnivagina elsteri CCALA 953]|uniref:Uncharacterized protein n=1 Tax=Brunnivagina elsteri CCALA 953 TaxID=987040 RepID=A0A2A2TMU8_9CYAN|nr:hypothetical protein CK510_05585 [Calothrix elsteri CCALA 953]